MTALAPASAATAESYRFLVGYIHRESGIALDQDKSYLLDARLLPIVEELSLPSLDSLCTVLRSNSDSKLKKRVVEAMTTHETLFFRDIAFFDGLKKEILPLLIERKKSSRKLRFWSAAASSGQEAYSLAMLLLEMGLGDWEIEILGTDISEQILDKAREGRYLQIEVNRGLPASYLIKYFERRGLDWYIRENLRRMIRFEPFDLRKSMRGKGPFDLIFCRNVLIYFDVETKRQILREIRGSLFGGGYLVLGATETTMNLDNEFKAVAGGRVALYQAPSKGEDNVGRL